MGEVTTNDGLLTVSCEDTVVVDPGGISSLPILLTNRSVDEVDFSAKVGQLQPDWFSGDSGMAVAGNTQELIQIEFHPPTHAVKNVYPFTLTFGYGHAFLGRLSVVLSVEADADGSIVSPVQSTTHAVSDSPADQDSLGFEEIADAFAALVESASTEPPITIGIEGTWGTGKSTLMMMIESRLRSPNIITIRFDVWENTDSSWIWAGLLRSVFRELESHVTRRQRLSFLWKRRWSNRYGRFSYWGPRLGGLAGGLLTVILVPIYADGDPVTLSGVFGGLATFASGLSFSGAVRNLLNSPATTQFRSFLSEFEPAAATNHIQQLSRDIEFLGSRIAEGTKIVIFVDNLDRVRSDQVVEVLEAVNLLLAKRLFIVFLGMDTDIVSRVVQGGNDYLEKIVQLPFRIPSINDGQLGEYVATLVPKVSKGSGPKKLAGPRPKMPPPNSEGRIGVVSRWAFRFRRPHRAEPIRRGELAALEHTVSERGAFERVFGLMSKRNPRQMKRLVNMYRLYKLLAARRGFRALDENYQEQLVKWVVAVGEWPQFLDLARFDPNLRTLRHVASQLRTYTIATGTVPFPDDSSPDSTVAQLHRYYPAFSRIWESNPRITGSEILQFLSLTP